MDRKEFVLDLSGHTEEDVLDLKDWLEHADLPGLSVSEMSKQHEGTMGPDLIPALVAVLSAPAIVQLVKVVRDWVKYRKKENKKIRVTVKSPDGSRITIESENM